MKVFLFLLIFTYSVTSFGQVKQNYRDCSVRLAEESYFWKLDSLGRNGFRNCKYNEFLKCNLDSVSKDYLRLHFGEPDRISKDNSGVYWYYLVFDGPAIPKEAKRALEKFWLAFKFDGESIFVAKIFETAEF